MSKIRITNNRRRFTAQRDTAGVAHVTALTWLDAMYGLGYLHAIDRGTQMLFSRAVACGQAGEQIAGHDELLETDCFFRRVGLHLDLDREVQNLNSSVGKQIAVYCDGVNDGLLARGRSLPMWATGFEGQPWDPAAVILIGRLLSFGGLAIGQFQNERLLIEMIHAAAHDAALRELFEPGLDDLDFDLMRQVKLSNKMSDEALDVLVDLPRLAGSNAWAVGPERSATGHALLASDPHLEINRLPAIWYEAALRWGDDYLMGATLPGGPLFAVARTARLAWGVTYLKGDTIDFFVEDCRRGGATGWQYRRADSWHDFEFREEVIDRKGREAQTMRVYENDQGTLEADPDEFQGGYLMSMAWAGRWAGSAKAISTWLDLAVAEDVAEAMDVIRDCPQPTLTFVLADRQGHIGLQGCGAFPRRQRPQAGLAPTPAWDSANHWDGWLSTDWLPSLYDPPEGFVGTANEECNPPEGPRLVTQPVHDYRVRRIRECLSELPQATLANMKAMQYDLVSIQARELLQLFLPYLPDDPIKQRLSNWDNRYDPESVLPTLFLRLYRNVMMELLGHERGIGWRRMIYLCSRVGYSNMLLTAADRLLRRDQSWWWHGRDKGAMIRRAAERLASEVDLQWAEVNNFHFVDRFFGTHRVGQLLGYSGRRQAMPGCHATLFQGHVVKTARREQTFAPSYHFVTDLGADEAWTNLPGGPSESRFSRYYRNDVPLWNRGEYKRLLPSI